MILGRVATRFGIRATEGRGDGQEHDTTEKETITPRRQIRWIEQGEAEGKPAIHFKIRSGFQECCPARGSSTRPQTEPTHNIHDQHCAEKWPRSSRR